MSILEVADVASGKPGQQIFSGVNFAVNESDVIALQGRSGGGKTTLLKCLSNLIVHDGRVLYRGKTAGEHGIPYFRTKVSYVPQRPPILPGSPRDFVSALYALGARKSPNSTTTGIQSIIEMGATLGLEECLWDREWASLSGGESQRAALAVAIGLNTAEILLLDEPTSALDPKSTAAVEQLLLNEVRSGESSLKAILWITHSEEQASRVATRLFQMGGGACKEVEMPPV
ncbi:P-loop containing nucleoside triphosphate hydrolase protein [Cylindrobasidium torrendii FP15055 ss-10]|uniref:p-loop containing nucleoside triphosphate hydrolase protein n=1 Tax=Cylindrobasidium torrendii FP15055 ss-10 TaxID=1314674 RepID=A0A0D7BAJ7_9AGAR|nr:P-loop containing nucleoside triphosphate hydrolase protein [Cylindrobasidium torrendii FP15055 ss-10]